MQNAAKRKDGQSPAQDETAPKSQKNGLSRLEEEIASIIAQTFADELGKAAHPEETLKGSEVEKLKGSESVAAASDREQPRGKTTPESTPGSFAPADGAKNISPNNRPAEAADYTAEHRAKVGQTGSWESLGLPSLREIAPDEPRGEGKTKLADARKRIAKGETIKDPLGASHEINAKTTSHWTKKGKNIADVNERLALLDEAEDTISKPHEIWKGVKRKGTAFIRMVKTPDGKSVINVAEMKDGTVSWHGNEVSFDYWREGKLLYVR